MASRSIRRNTNRISWSDLPVDLLLIMISKLIDIFDFVHFGAVCRQWRNTLWRYRNNIPPQLPLLLVASRGNSPDRYFKFCLINFSNGVHTKVLREYEYDFVECYYASHGWLLAVDTIGRYPLLINPFLSSDNSIELPSPFLSSDQQLGFGAIKKVVLSDNPAKTSSYVVMVMGYDFNIKFLKSGNKSWTHMRGSSGFKDGTYYKGTGCFYFLASLGEIVCADLTSNQPRKKQSQFARTDFGVEWLVESSLGELFAVQRNYSDEKPFSVYKLVGSEWMGLSTLGDHILFLGANSFMFPDSASNSGVFRRNHIYYGQHDMREFNMEDRCSYRLLGEKFASCIETKPIWVQPTLNMSNFTLACNEHQLEN